MFKLVNPQYGIASALKRAVSNIYVVLRNICAVALLCLLIYTGIRILLASASPYKQSEWKRVLIDWLKALCALVFMHFLMIGVFYISDKVTASLSASIGDGQSLVGMIRNAFINSSWLDGTEAILTTIMYAYVTYLTVLFAVAYFKRLVWVVILIVISPIVAITPAFGGQQKSIFTKWFKEYTYTVFLQPFHLLIFWILVGIPLGMLGNSVSGVSILDQFDFVPKNYGVFIYILISISMIRPAEKFLYNLFGFTQSQVSKQGTSESGLKTIKAVEKVIKDTVKTAATVVASVYTGGAAGALMKGGGAMAAKGAGSMASKGGGGGLSLGKGSPMGEGGLSLGGETPGDGNLPGGNNNQFPSIGSEYDDENAFDWASRDKIHENDSLMYDQDYALPEKKEWNEDEINEFLDGLGLEGEDREKMAESLRESSSSEEHKNREENTDNLVINVSNAEINASNAELNGNENAQLEAPELEAPELEAPELEAPELEAPEFNVSDAELNAGLGDQNKLMERLRNTKAYQEYEKIKESPYTQAGIDYLKSPDMAENVNNIRQSAGELRDTMYLDDSPREYEKGIFGTQARGKAIEEKKKGTVNAFVNNKNNIEYMKQEHGLDEKGAKARLEACAPYVNKGITNVAVIDKMLTAQQTKGLKPEAAMISATKEVKAESVINDQSRVSAVAQIISKETGEKAESPKVQQEAKTTLQQAKPYVEKGQKDPEVLHRLVQLENKLSNLKVGQASRTPEKVMRMDNVINKALRDGMKKIKITNANSSQGMKQIETAMNKELEQRRTLGSGAQKSKTQKTSKKN